MCRAFCWILLRVCYRCFVVCLLFYVVMLCVWYLHFLYVVSGCTTTATGWCYLFDTFLVLCLFFISVFLAGSSFLLFPPVLRFFCVVGRLHLCILLYRSFFLFYRVWLCVFIFCFCCWSSFRCMVFSFIDATTPNEIYTLYLLDALAIYLKRDDYHGFSYAASCLASRRSP